MDLIDTFHDIAQPVQDGESSFAPSLLLFAEDWAVDWATEWLVFDSAIVLNEGCWLWLFWLWLF